MVEKHLKRAVARTRKVGEVLTAEELSDYDVVEAGDRLFDCEVEVSKSVSRCPHCGYEWEPRVSKPKECPRCKRRLDRPPRNPCMRRY